VSAGDLHPTQVVCWRLASGRHALKLVASKPTIERSAAHSLQEMHTANNTKRMIFLRRLRNPVCTTCTGGTTCTCGHHAKPAGGPPALRFVVRNLRMRKVRRVRTVARVAILLAAGARDTMREGTLCIAWSLAGNALYLCAQRTRRCFAISKVSGPLPLYFEGCTYAQTVVSHSKFGG
jgi:hypothetical protein